MGPSMHCPGCGTEAPLTQKFCRSCGLSLDKVPQLVAQQPSESPARKDSEKLQRRQQEIDHWLSITGIGFIMLVAISALIGLIYLMSVGSLPIVPGIVIMILVVGGFGAGMLAMYSEKLKKSLSSSDLGERLISEGETKPTATLESFERPFLSVTESTTNLLDKDDALASKDN